VSIVLNERAAAMSKYLVIACTLAAAASFVLAWQWIVTFEPSNPIVPLALTFLSGFALRQAAV
jgi:hypothetical protein